MKWLLAFHIISIICWFAGLFYLPRLFVYHASSPHAVVHEQLKIMEYKLYFYITTPALVATLLTGFWLMFFYFHTTHPHIYWLPVKVPLVFLLIIFHAYCGYFLYQFRKDRNTKDHRFYRFFNEIPTLLMLAIVILAVVKPF